MSREGYRGPKLPRLLLDQVQNGAVSKKRGGNVLRKDQRKAQRQQKKAVRSRPESQRPSNAPVRQKGRGSSDSDSEPTVQVQTRHPPSKYVVKKHATEAKPVKSILKKSAPLPESESDHEAAAEAEEPVLSRNVKQKLSKDDAEIATLEKKLGIKGKKSTALESDGLDWLADGSDGGSDDGFGGQVKRKRKEDTDWLRSKRLKAGVAEKSSEDEANDEVSDKDAFNQDEAIHAERDLESTEVEDEEVDRVSDGFEGFESGASESVAYTVCHREKEPAAPERQRENPYVAPVSAVTLPTAKYIPPSLRKPAESDEETLRQLRRQLQGLLNRLSEANMLSILQSLEEMYAKNARHHITSTLVDLLIGLIADRSTLNDTFLILHAGFSAAVFRVIGNDFGALLLEKAVQTFDRHYSSDVSEGKQTLNLLAFLACLYTFQVVGSVLLFDYIRLLLAELSESNTELLLRVIRTSGQQLRQNDPSALKDIVQLLQRSAASIGEENMSVRTRFMIETIDALKNNRLKNGTINSTVAAEHTNRMKKILGSLNSSRSVKVTEPLRIGLSDIRDSDKKGKWWLVGASYMDPAKHPTKASTTSRISQTTHDEDAGYESETPGHVNLNKLARTQGMNSDVRRAIFVTILSSSDPKEAHERLLRLNLRSKQMLEIPKIIVHCAGAEQKYNPFYASIAHHFCGEHKLRKAFEFTLWDVFKEMDVEEDDAVHVSESKVMNLAKLYGSLLANRSLDLTALKQLDFTYLEEQKSMFVEQLCAALFVQIRRAGKKTDAATAIKAVFARTAGVEGLPQGLLLFFEDMLSKVDGFRGKEKRAVEEGMPLAMEALAHAAKAAPAIEVDEDSNS